MATRNALAQLAFTAEEVRLTAEVAAAVLHLGQLEFRRLRGSIGEGDKYSESCRIADDGPLLLAAGLLGVDAEAMQKCIVCRSMNIKGGGDVSIEEIPLSADKAASSRDALAKLLYAKLFDWLVGRINAALTADAGGAAAAAKICILDIFGFEIFEHNSFEQLLINFANEKLQQHFNLHVFKMEEGLYEAEGIEYGSVGFVDNQARRAAPRKP